MDLISVIIPVYKVEPYLDRCIQSVVNQTYKNLEIILVDDGSPDNCPAMCDAWAEKDSRIRVIHKENGGVSSARNVGIQAASGEFFFFLDSDDSIKRDALLLLLKCQQMFESDVTIAGHEFRLNDRVCSEEPIEFESIPKHIISPDDFFKLGMQKRWITGRLIRREFATTARFIEEVSHGEDAIYFYNIMMNKVPTFSIVDCKLYIYYLRDSSISAGKQGLIAYSILGKWCIENWTLFHHELKRYILLEGLKNLFIFRFEFKGENEVLNKEENNKAIRKAVSMLWGARAVSIKEQLGYSALAFFPSLYSFYIKRKNKG